MPDLPMYVSIIDHIFFSHYTGGATRLPFLRTEIATAAAELGIKAPANFGDLIYTFRFRRDLPQTIRQTTTDAAPWVIRLSGIGKYRFEATSLANILPTLGKAQTKVPDATPGIIMKNKLNDEQALLAMLRYNRLVDIFTGVMCYSLQNHLRTQVPDLGQTETDEVYLGVDKRGIQYVFPVEAKAGNDKLSIVQVEQDYFMCRAKFPTLVCRPIAAQFMRDGAIAVFDFEESNGELFIANERHYRLVPAKDISDEELVLYQQRLGTE